MIWQHFLREVLIKLFKIIESFKNNISPVPEARDTIILIVSGILTGRPPPDQPCAENHFSRELTSAA